jgi:tetratricopeptide (TPR) repeat protein
MQKARDTADPRYYARAAARYQHALKLNPQNVGALTGLADVAGARNDVEQSIHWARQALALKPAHAPAFGLLGDAALALGDYAGARQHYQKMLDLQPDLAAYCRSAHLVYLNGDVRKATWLIQQALAADPAASQASAECRAQLALIHWHNGALLVAEQVLQKALEIFANDRRLLLTLAKIKTSKRDYPGAIDYYQRALKIGAEPDAVIALGDLYALTGDSQKAEQQYARLAALQATRVASGVRDDLSLARFDADHARNLPAALQQAEAVWARRKNLLVADTLAWCLYQNARYADATKIIRHALKLGTPDAHMLFHAGMIHAKAGERETAKRYLFEALSLNGAFHPRDAVIAADTLKILGDAATTTASVAR